MKVILNQTKKSLSQVFSLHQWPSPPSPNCCEGREHKKKELLLQTFLQDEYCNLPTPCSHHLKTDKAQLELNLVRDMEGSMEGFCKYNSKRKAKGNLLLLGVGGRVSKDMEEA